MTVQANRAFSGSQWSEVESLSARDARRLQDERLREQLAYLAARSEFYRAKFAGHGVDPGAVRSVDDLAGLPFTDKQELRDSLAAFPPLGSHLAAAADEIVQIQASSGTTGSPSYVGLTAPDVRTWCELGARALYANGFRPGDRLLHAFGMSKGFVGGLPAVRENLESPWGATSREMLGGTDVACTYWGECGMHFLSPDLMVAELIDPETGERVEPAEGAQGELVYTALRRQASPLLRFRTRDHVVVTGTSCSCGRTGYKVRCVGRTDDMLIVRGIKTVVELVPEGTLKRPDYVKVALIECVDG
jgi:phenylacetate-coenzyme A ligase PaaK-like adenylate-forming protein